MSGQAAYDVVVVGGGITGAGVARDLARRGVSVLLLEQDDYGSATTGASSWLLHGGTRYLTFDWDTTWRSAEDVGRIVGIARHLVHRVVFLLPVLPGDRNGMERLETALEVYDRLQPAKRSHVHVRLTPDTARRLEPGLAPAILGALTMDEWGVDPRRLTWLNVQDAVAHGAQALNHARVERLELTGGGVTGVAFRRHGVVSRVATRVVVNATGPWADRVAGMAGCRVDLRPTKGVHVVFDRRLSNFAVGAETVDGRSLLLVPTEATTLLGTTDEDYFGDPSTGEVNPEEVDYLLAGMARVFPAIAAQRALRATAGVRPTLFQARVAPDAVSRRFQVFDHSRRERITGLISVAGGKLSLYLSMAEATAEATMVQLRRRSRGDAAGKPLPGQQGELEPASQLGEQHRLPDIVVGRLQRRHGTEAGRILSRPGASRLVCRCEAVTEAELAHAVEEEGVTTLPDAFRRVGLAAGPCAGTRCVDGAAGLLGRSLGWSLGQQREAAHEMFGWLWRQSAAVLDERGWAQAELWRAATAAPG